MTHFTHVSVLKICFQKSTRSTSFVRRNCQRLFTLSCFLVIIFCLFLHLKKKVISWTNRPRFHKSETTLSKQFPLNLNYNFLKSLEKQVFLNFFVLFSTLSFRMSRNVCKMRHKLQNAEKELALTFVEQVFTSQLCCPSPSLTSYSIHMTL